MGQFYGDNGNEDYDDITLLMKIIVAGKPDQFRLLYKSNFETQVTFLIKEMIFWVIFDIFRILT